MRHLCLAAFLLSLASLYSPAAAPQTIDEPVLQAVPLPSPAPSLSACPGGYFTAEVTDGFAPNIHPGTFGVELLLDEPGTRLLQGGLNFGALIDAGQPGFAAINIANANQERQRLNLRLYGSAATARDDELIVNLEIQRRHGEHHETVYSRQVTLSLADPFETSLEVTPGYYLAIVSAHARSPEEVGGAAEGEFFFSLTTQYLDRPGGAFQGGAVVGGYHAPHPFGGVSGFAGFCLATPHTLSAKVFSAPSYGAAGAADLQIRLRDHRRNMLESAPAGQFRQVVTQLPPSDRPRLLSMAFGADGFPLFASHLPPSNELQIFRCLDHTCAQRTVNSFSGGQGQYVRGITGITVGANGAPIISYLTHESAYVASCSDPDCAGPVEEHAVYTQEMIAETLDSADLVVAADGLPAIALALGRTGVQAQFLPKKAVLLKCVDPTCAAAPTITQISDPGSSRDGLGMQIELGSDGNPFLAYYNQSANELQTAHCTDPSCSGDIIRSQVATLPRISFDDYLIFSLAIGADGNPVLFQLRFFEARVRVARCQDPECLLPANQNDLVNVLTPGFELAIGDERIPYKRYQPEGEPDPRYFTCASAGLCPEIDYTPPSDLISTHSTIGTDGLPIFRYATSEGEFGVIKCGTRDCRP